MAKIEDITLGELIEAIAEAVAKKLGGTASGPAKETVTPAVDDGEPEGKPSSNKRKRTKPAKQQEEAPPEEEEEETEEDDDDGDGDESTDLTTEAQQELAKEALVDEDGEEIEQDDMVSQLTDYYTSDGTSKKEVAESLADMEEQEIKEAYLDYCARCIKEEDGELDFIDDLEVPYKATRINDGEESLFWCIGGITLTDEEVEEKELGDPNAKPKAKKTVSRRPAAGKKKK